MPDPSEADRSTPVAPMVTVAAEDLAAAVEHLGSVWDEGPWDEGWKSDELKALICRLEAALKPSGANDV